MTGRAATRRGWRERRPRPRYRLDTSIVGAERQTRHTPSDGDRWALPGETITPPAGGELFVLMRHRSRLLCRDPDGGVWIIGAWRPESW